MCVVCKFLRVMGKTTQHLFVKLRRFKCEKGIDNIENGAMVMSFC